MARFALECLSAMNELIKEMEVTLGPGTADLAMRFGLHSGPVTAGVLRGEKSRFQLFGDTINTASRMESTSKPGYIQVSHETSNLIAAAGKEHWLDQRDGMVAVKGKGEMQVSRT
jgi:class 3 adenylate cyclase